MAATHVELGDPCVIGVDAIRSGGMRVGVSKLLVGRLLLSDLARRNKLLRAVERLRLRVAKLVGRESEGAVRAETVQTRETRRSQRRRERGGRLEVCWSSGGCAHVVWRGLVERHDGVVHPLLPLHRDRVRRRLAVVDAEALAVEGQMARVSWDVVKRLLLEGVAA